MTSRSTAREGKKALMACGNYWNSPIQVGSQHIAAGLVDEGHLVGFISDPISPLHLAGGITPELRDKYALYRGNGRWFLDGRLWAYVPGALVTSHDKPLLRSPLVVRRWHELTWPRAAGLVRRRGFGHVDVLYLDSLIQAFWLDAVSWRRSVLRISDRTDGFRSCTAATRDLERELVRRVDLVVYTAANLAEYVGEMKPRRMAHLPNGVRFDHFARADRTPPADYAAIARPIAVYVGAMRYWFDFDLVNEVASRMSDVSFVLIGPDEMARSRLEPLPNVHLLGKRSYEKLPAYLWNADVGIIPFDVAGHGVLVHSINPLKMYEYMACGLDVVAVEWEELRNINSPALLCKDADEFAEKLRTALAGKGRSERNIAYAEGHDWSRRVKQLLAALSAAEAH